jgi:hypothetical protein
MNHDVKGFIIKLYLEKKEKKYKELLEAYNKLFKEHKHSIIAADYNNYNLVCLRMHMIN